MHLIDTRLNKKSAEVLVKKLGFELDNGFALKQMKGAFASSQELTQLDFKIETEHSQSELVAKADGNIFEMMKDPDKIRNAIVSFQKNRISLLDLFYFKEDLKDVPTLSTLSKAPLEIDGDFGLDLSKIVLSDISVSQDNNFSIAVDGNASLPLQLKKANGNLTFDISAQDSLWLQEIIKDFDDELAYSALRSFTLSGSVSGTMGNSVLNVALESNLGVLDLSGIINLKNEDFDLNTTFSDLKPGDLLQMEALGAFSGTAAFTGRGFHPDSLSARASLLLDSLILNDYRFTNFSITAELQPGLYEFNLLVDDPGLKTGLYSTIDRKDSSLTLIANGKLFAQLEKIHLTKDTLSVETTVTASYSKTPRNLDAEMSLKNIELISPYEQANIQQLSALISIDSSETQLQADADFLKTDISIGEPLEQVGSFMKKFQSYLMTFIDSSGVEADTRISKLPTTNITGNISYHEALGMIIQDTGIQFQQY